MEKNYLAGFRSSAGLPTPEMFSMMGRCLGYFESLSAEGLLKNILFNEPSAGFVPVGEEHFEGFCKQYGRDVKLWEMLTARTKKDKKMGVHLIRAEIGDLEACKERILYPHVMLQNAVRSLNRHYLPLQFSVYASDIEAKS